jgi:peroxiredoxin
MVLLESDTPKIGSSAPGFELPATDGSSYALGDFEHAQVLVVMFICNHCPYVKAVVDRLVDLGNTFDEEDAAFVAISSNDAERYPDDSFEKMAELAEAKDFPFPYLYDESQEVARAYKAVCTPDFFVYDGDRRLAYAGRLDDNWKNPDEVQRRDLHDAVVALLNGERPDEEQHPSRGCSIKWKQ